MLIAAGIVAVLVVVGLALALSGGGDDGPARLKATGSTRGIPDASPVGRLGGRAALLRLKSEMRPGDDLSTISLTSFHAVADLGTANGGGRVLSIKDVPDGDVEVDGDSGGPIDPGARVAALDPDAPGRLLAAVLRGLGPDTRPRILETKASTVGLDGSGGLRWTIDLAGPGATQSWSGDEHGRHVIRDSDGTPAPPEGSAGPALTPTGVNESSLVRPATLRRQLDAVAARPEAQGGVTYLSVAPKELAVSFELPLGSPDAQGRERIRNRTFTVDAAGGITIDENVIRAERSDNVGVPLAAVDPEAPLRALEAIGRRDGDDAAARVRTADFRSVDPLNGETSPVWEFELQDGRQRVENWTARADGSGVREGGG